MRIKRQKKACKKCNRFLRFVGIFKRPETKCPCEADAGFFDVPTGIMEIVTKPRVRPDQPTYSYRVTYDHHEIGVYEDFHKAIAARKQLVKARKRKK